MLVRTSSKSHATPLITLHQIPPTRPLGSAVGAVSIPLQGLRPRGGGGTPLYKVYRYVPPQRVWFLSRFGLKMGIDFEHFGLKLGIIIGGTFTKAYKIIFLPSHWGK